eukprot:3833693-Rhodomonas_salina.2
MDIEAFSKYYVDPVSLDAEDNNTALPHVFKQMSILKIGPDETDAKENTRNVITFNNKNLDIINDPANSYLYIKVGFKVTDNAGTANQDLYDVPEHQNSVDTVHLRRQGFSFTFNGDATPANSTVDDITINGTTITPTFNYDSVTPANSTVSFTYSYTLPDGKVVSKTYSPTFNHDSGTFTNSTISDIDVEYPETVGIGHWEPVGLPSTANWIAGYDYKWNDTTMDNQNNSLSASLYAINLGKYTKYHEQEKHYGLVENYSPIEDKSGEVWRISTKGLNSRPRWLILHAIDGAVATLENDTYYPLGFATTDTVNQVWFTKLRLKINGIYLDQGTVWESTDIDNVTTTPDGLSKHGGYIPQYENYVKFFNKLHNTKELAPMSFQDWLQKQIYVFDLVNGIDSDQIFANSGNALIIELEYSTKAGSTVGNDFKFKLCANLLHDKRIKISQSENKAVLEQY